MYNYLNDSAVVRHICTLLLTYAIQDRVAMHIYTPIRNEKINSSSHVSNKKE